jgi:hypothetical protein
LLLLIGADELSIRERPNETDREREREKKKEGEGGGKWRQEVSLKSEYEIGNECLCNAVLSKKNANETNSDYYVRAKLW